jgi:hypothetical protein
MLETYKTMGPQGVEIHSDPSHLNPSHKLDRTFP